MNDHRPRSRALATQLRDAADALVRPSVGLPTHATLLLRAAVGGVFVASGAVKFLFVNQGPGRFARIGLPDPAALSSSAGARSTSSAGHAPPSTAAPPIPSRTASACSSPPARSGSSWHRTATPATSTRQGSNSDRSTRPPQADIRGVRGVVPPEMHSTAAPIRSRFLRSGAPCCRG